MLLRRCSLGKLLVAVVAAVPALNADPLDFVVHNLVSNQPGVADFTDANLVNAWGLAASATSPFWVGNNGTGTSTIYNGAGVASALIVSIPGDGSVTGVTFTGSGGFGGDAFLFASEDGTVSGWRGPLGTNAETLVAANPDNVYKGIAYASNGGFSYGYLANFKTGAIDVLKGDTGAPDLPGSFTDPGLPANYAPFNVANIGGTLYVTYAVKEAGSIDEVAGPGNGIVSTFDLNGNFISRLVTGGDLNAPWGLALAPAGLMEFSGALLVGNFGDGTIHAYDPISGAAIGALQGPSGAPIAIDGLWGLRFGNGGNGGKTGVLYFTAGPDDESNGLFGNIAPVPEPGTWLLTGIALLPILLRRIRTR